MSLRLDSIQTLASKACILLSQEHNYCANIEQAAFPGVDGSALLL